MVVHVRPTLTELAFALTQIVLPRDAEIILGAKIVFATHDRAHDCRGIRTFYQLKRINRKNTAHKVAPLSPL
jgi:hypothetical protein